jgi:hypothetical protein
LGLERASSAPGDLAMPVKRGARCIARSAATSGSPASLFSDVTISKSAFSNSRR